jgi:hypothetical protein
MAKKQTSSKKVNLQAVEASVTAAIRKLSGSSRIKQGNILLRLTDSGEQLWVEGSSHELRTAKSAPTLAPMVEIAGSSAVIKAILDGKLEASRAFAAGGLRVQGDLPYLEALLKELGVLNCE